MRAPVSPQLRPLLDRRLVVVSGKGGTGKTTLVATLALAAADRGLRVAIVETGRRQQIPALFEVAGPGGDYEGIRLPEGPWAMRMEPYAALAEYLQLQLRIPGLVTRLLDQAAFHALLDAAPGWRELITLGKVWHLEQARDRGEPVWDLLIIDAPATGHGLTFLDVPGVVIQAVRAGPLRRHVEWVEAMVQDAERTLLLPITLPEELPVRETLELVERARGEVGIAVDRIVVNGVVDEPLRPPLPDLAERLAALPPGGAPDPRALVHAFVHRRERAALHREAIETLTHALDLPLTLLPSLESGVLGVGPLRSLGRALFAAEART
ncbi:MAG: hypothetical protein CL910_03700 [Deltaproteobacteria bacterium]|jgi:anion-transporting  ArsA/GET3 family ATPase|nr:hypothetical protein [Deltaproteobacteria bacterium]